MMVLSHLPLQLMDLGLQLSICCLGLFVQLERGSSLLVDGLVVLQRTLLLPFLLGQSLLLLHQSVTLPSEEGHLVLLILNLNVLVIRKGSLDTLDLLLETSDHTLLLVSLATVLLGDFL